MLQLVSQCVLSKHIVVFYRSHGLVVPETKSDWHVKAGSIP